MGLRPSAHLSVISLLNVRRIIAVVGDAGSCYIQACLAVPSEAETGAIADSLTDVIVNDDTSNNSPMTIFHDKNGAAAESNGAGAAPAEARGARDVHSSRRIFHGPWGASLSWA